MIALHGPLYLVFRESSVKRQINGSYDIINNIINLKVEKRRWTLGDNFAPQAENSRNDSGGIPER